MLNFISDNKDWLDEESAGCQFKDERLGKRFTKLLTQMWDGIGASIPFACQDWANTKAAYRFFSNTRITEHEILQGHFESTHKRADKIATPILVLQDTTELSFQRENPEQIGSTRVISNGRAAYGQLKRHTICGILMHSRLVVTTTGLPLGLAAIKFWTRKKFKGCNALKKRVNPTRIPIHEKESFRWLQNMRESTELLNQAENCVHIGDRESDIYELFCMAQELGTHFLVRTCVDRLAGDGEHTIIDEMNEVKVKGQHRVEVRDKKGNLSKAVLEIKYRRIKVLPPIGKHKKYPALYLTVIHAVERGKPKNRDPIVWKLLTDLSVSSRKEAIEKLEWYALRWKIEIFHKIFKSGCKAESSKLRTAAGLAKLMALFCILSWRIFWMTMLTRTSPHASPKLALTQFEITLLDSLAKNNKETGKKDLSYYLTKIACLGGYLNRASDAPPGNRVMWRGLTRLTDIALGFYMALKIVGN
jgi:hypothetical protein